MSPGPLLVRAALAVVLFAFAGAPSAFAAGGKQKPSAAELQNAYPLEATATATATAAQTTATITAPERAAATATPAAGGGGGAPWLIIGLAVLIAGAVGGLWLAARRRRPAPAPRPREAAAAPGPDRTAERLRDAVDIRRSREWPWPDGSEELWRCEIAPDSASLSAHFRAVVHPPGGGAPAVIAESTAAPAGAGDWQSAAPLEDAVAALARELEKDGWEPVDAGGDPHVRRFCRRTPPQIAVEETEWTAHRN